jgi:putative NADPH-quinone reductase
MKILVVLGHPDRKSFNAAIAHQVVETLRGLGHEVVFNDLYREGFNPILAKDEIPQETKLDKVLARHCQDLAQAEGIVIVHPNWWGMPPALLKGWIDRVFRPGVAYEFLEGDAGEGVPNGLLKAKSVVVFNTSNTMPQREMEELGDPLETLWKNCVFKLCGVRDFHRTTFGVIVISTQEQRQAWLEQAAQTVRDVFPAEK